MQGVTSYKEKVFLLTAARISSLKTETHFGAAPFPVGTAPVRIEANTSCVPVNLSKFSHIFYLLYIYRLFIWLQMGFHPVAEVQQ
jgi:hypothetical protein